MEANKKTYQIYFCLEKKRENEPIENLILNEKNDIPEEDIQIKESYYFDDFKLNTTIEYLKRSFFSTTLSLKYKCCDCMLQVYYKTKKIFRILSDVPDKKLSECGDYNDLYLIKLNSICNCEYKKYNKYMNIHKFDIIRELKEVNNDNEKKIKELEESNNKEKSEKDKLIEKLKKEIDILKKTNELKNYNKAKLEKFYDIVIDINSVKRLNTDGWKVKFTKRGLNKYKQYKDKKLITIGVIGNNNKGKSFLLSKLSKIKLLTGTSIQTEGLSVKYPKLKGYKGRQIILLDSAGLETPVLRNEQDENEIKEEKKEEKEIKEEKRDENEIKDDLKDENEIKEEHNNNNDSKKNEEIQKIQNEEIKKQNNDKEIKQNKIFKENAKDKIMTELFLENFIIKKSDILLIVVGKLTYSEQLLINKLKVECKNQNKGRIFIVHNLQDFRKKEQVEDYIKNTLLKCGTFNLNKKTWITTEKDNENQNSEEEEEEEKEEEENDEDIKEEEKDEKIIEKKEERIEEEKDDKIIEKNEEKKEEEDVDKKKEEKINNIKINNDINEKNVKDDYKLNNVHFSEILYYGDKKLEVYHLIIANEDSEAGIIYNQYAYNFIKSVYNLISENKQFDIFEEVQNNFKDLSNTILKTNIENANFTKIDDIIKNKIMKLESKEEIVLKQCYIDELGFSLFKTGNFEPKYNYFKADGNTLEIRIEIPGNAKCKVTHKVIKDKIVIIVKGEKRKDKIPQKPEDNIVNLREFSKFELNIYLPIEELQIIANKPKEGYPKFDKGICFIQYELAKEVTEEEVETKDDI